MIRNPVRTADCTRYATQCHLRVGGGLMCSGSARFGGSRSQSLGLMPRGFCNARGPTPLARSQRSCGVPEVPLRRFLIDTQ